MSHASINLADDRQRKIRARRHPAAFTLIELLVVVSIIALLISILVPTLSTARIRTQRVKCSANLRGIGLAMMNYAAGEPNRGFPRAVYRLNQNLQLDNAGYLVPDTFGNSGYVGDNNVPASMFLLMKSEHLEPKLFICPSTQATPGFIQGNTDINQSSNWGSIPDNLSYSLATPYPGPAGVNAGFAWRDTLDATFALAADMNPGTRGGSNPPNNVVGPPHNATTSQMAAANSNNHQNKGQNVLYGDFHVEFAATPYCGATHLGTGIPDNIFTAGAGDGGTCDEKSYPVDAQDSVMLPTDDPGGK
jgi:prepilin-type N-terminal cleavage/methylation domain-containing protein